MNTLNFPPNGFEKLLIVQEIWRLESLPAVLERGQKPLTRLPVAGNVRPMAQNTRLGKPTPRAKISTKK
jgi:hypothetical protein